MQRARLSYRIAYRIALIWLALVLLATLSADWLPMRDALQQNLIDMLKPPSAAQWFGTDSLGRDVFARTLYGFRITLAVSLGSVVLALAAGTVIGVCAGYFRGWIERAILAVIDVLLAFPPLVLIIAMVAYPGSPLIKVVVALAVVFTPATTRIARANTLRLSSMEFVTAARAAGMHDVRIIFRELLPNLIPPMLAYGLLLVAIAALAEAALSFLGLGIPPPTPSLGSMMAGEQSRVMDAPHAVFFPALMLFLTIFALNIVGEDVQRRHDGRAGAAG